MNALIGNLGEILKNPHTSIPGLLIVLCALGEIWFPQYSDQFHKTREFAMGYGLIMGAQIKRPATDGNGKSVDTAPEQAKTPEETTKP